MNSSGKMQEMCATLESIESSYTPGAPGYRFSRVFYNIVNGPVERPVDFPVALWNKYFIPNASLMPVILNRTQIEERKVQQNELITKLNESKSGLLKRIDGLKTRREMVRSKLEGAVGRFRRVVNGHVFGEPCDGVYKIQAETLDRERLGVRSNRDELVGYLVCMNERLAKLEGKVSETVRSAERKIGQSRQGQ